MILNDICPNFHPIKWGIHYRMHLELKSREISFAHNFFSELSNRFERVGQLYCRVMCTIIYDWQVEMNVMIERHFVRFEFKLIFVGIFNSATYNPLHMY